MGTYTFHELSNPGPGGSYIDEYWEYDHAPGVERSVLVTRITLLDFVSNGGEGLSQQPRNIHKPWADPFEEVSQIHFYGEWALLLEWA